ncbi:MAG: PTS system trehalose-specific EIIBC component [Lactobacillales bacterium]|nr:PTS system trehalose-specific EIIBC component [Lactobacillales bacterium]
MSKFEKDAKDLLNAVGGKDNIAAVSHCATRMRFVLNDESKTDKDKIEDIPSVKGTFTNAGQFQVIIGNEVPMFYNDFASVSGVDGVSKEQAKSVAKQNQNPIQRAVAMLAEIFTPLLPAIIVGGLILGFRNVLEGVNFGFLGGQTITASSQFWAGINDFLWLPGEAIFHFLPVGITWSIAKKMGTTQILGIVLGITLVSPQLLNAYAVNATKAADIPFWDFGFAQIDKIGYQAQVIPAMLAGFLLAYLEIFFRKHIPQAVSMIFVPFLSLVPTILAAHVILGPIGWKIGGFISSIVNAGLTSSFNWLFGAAFGLLYAPLVITGLHHTTLAIDTQLVADYGSTNLWPMIALSNIAQGAAVLAVIYLHRGDEKEEQISIPATISAFLGVTEPAMFGINLKYVYPFVAGMIGSAVAGMYVTFTSVRATSIGIGGLPGILSIVAKNVPNFAVGMVIALVVPIVLTVVFRRANIFNKIDREIEEMPLVDATDADLMPDEAVNQPVRTMEELPEIDVESPLVGHVLPLSEANDPVFSEGMLGVGVVIEPKEGKLYAPFDGDVVTLFPTGHAIGLVNEEGAELLIHIGLDTVKLEGKYFTMHVKQGDTVKQGDLLIEFDKDAIERAGYVTQTPVVVTNPDNFLVNIVECHEDVTPKDKIFSIKKIII